RAFAFGNQETEKLAQGRNTACNCAHGCFTATFALGVLAIAKFGEIGFEVDRGRGINFLALFFQEETNIREITFISMTCIKSSTAFSDEHIEKCLYTPGKGCFGHSWATWTSHCVFLLCK